MWRPLPLPCMSPYIEGGGGCSPLPTHTREMLWCVSLPQCRDSYRGGVGVFPPPHAWDLYRGGAGVFLSSLSPPPPPCRDSYLEELEHPSVLTVGGGGDIPQPLWKYSTNHNRVPLHSLITLINNNCSQITFPKSLCLSYNCFVYHSLRDKIDCFAYILLSQIKVIQRVLSVAEIVPKERKPCIFKYSLPPLYSTSLE